MSAVMKVFSNFKLGKQRFSSDADPSTQPDLKRANAKLQKKNKIHSSLGSATGECLQGSSITLKPHTPSSLLQGSFRSYSFEPGTSVENFQAELEAHSKPLQQRSRNVRVDERRGFSTPMVMPKFGLHIDHAKLSNPGNRVKSALHLPSQPGSHGVEESMGAVYGRYGLVVHPSNLFEASEPRSLDVSPTFSETYSDFDPYQNAKSTSRSWSSIPTLAERRGLDESWQDSGRMAIATSWKEASRSFNESEDLVWEESGRSLIRSYLTFGIPESQQSVNDPLELVLGKGKGREVNDEAGTLLHTLRSPTDLSVDSGTVKRCRYDEWLGQRYKTLLCVDFPEFRERQSIPDDLLQVDWIERLFAPAPPCTCGLCPSNSNLEAYQGRIEPFRAASNATKRLRDCVACADSMDPLKFPAKSPTSACTHRPNTCYTCLQAWMSSEFETKGCEGIKCPECPQTLEYGEVQKAASRETFEVYDKLATRNALGAYSEFAWCLKAGCNSGQLNIDNNDFMMCASCGYEQCLRHKVAWHKGETCEQYEYRSSGQKARDEENATEKMIDTVSKKCPGLNCGWRIQKTSGCEHMTCKKCRHQFCWQCLAAHTEIKRIGNTAHAKSCKFHSDNLDVTYPFNAH